MSLLLDPSRLAGYGLDATEPLTRKLADLGDDRSCPTSSSSASATSRSWRASSSWPSTSSWPCSSTMRSRRWRGSSSCSPCSSRPKFLGGEGHRRRGLGEREAHGLGPRDLRHRPGPLEHPFLANSRSRSTSPGRSFSRSALDVSSAGRRPASPGASSGARRTSASTTSCRRRPRRSRPPWPQAPPRAGLWRGCRPCKRPRRGHKGAAAPLSPRRPRPRTLGEERQRRRCASWAPAASLRPDAGGAPRRVPTRLSS